MHRLSDLQLLNLQDNIHDNKCKMRIFQCKKRLKSWADLRSPYSAGGKTKKKLFCCTIIPSLHISGQQSPDLATALLCQGCHTPVAHHRQALPPQDHCWNVLLKDQPYHFLSLLPCKGAPTRLTFPQQTESRQKSPQKTTLQEEDRRPGSYHFALSS